MPFPGVSICHICRHFSSLFSNSINIGKFMTERPLASKTVLIHRVRLLKTREEGRKEQTKKERKKEKYKKRKNSMV
jgi:hypothetical protein